MRIEVEKRVIASFPPDLFEKPMIETLEPGEVTVDLARQELDETRAITFLDAEKGAIFRDRIRIAATRWVEWLPQHPTARNGPI